MSSAFARSLFAVLGDVPLVVVNSRNARLKRLAHDVFEREAAEPSRLFDAVAQRTEERRAQGMPTSITPRAGALFMTHDGERRSLDIDGDGYVLRGTGVRFTRAELASIAREKPESLSPNVALRPIVQDAIHPTAMYVGGPTELAYLEQVAPAYAAFGIDPPAFTARPFVVLLEPKTKRALEVAEVSLEEVMREDFRAASHVVDATLEEQIDVARDHAVVALTQATASFASITTRIDPTLEKALGATRAAAEKGIDEFAKRLRSALKRRSQTEIDRLETARELVLPSRHLQERTLNVLYYINKYGVDRCRHALERVDRSHGVLQVIDL
jgi:bacillithiol biosynthesis cysteine-adding enzyme BshC